MDIKNSGPYLKMAIFCEKVLEEKDGVLSAIRIVDRMNITAGQDGPEIMPLMAINFYGLFSFRAGTARGKYTMKISPRTPSGGDMPEFSVPVMFEGEEDSGANVIINMSIQVKEEGLYWFNILLNEEVVTRVPLRIVYQKMKIETSIDLS